METSLHRQLKALYCVDATQREVWVDGYRIDAIVDGVLIEIQQASLAALRDKTRELLLTHRVLVVKPLAARKRILRRARSGGEVQSSRMSPSRETLLHLFEDLVHFVNIFPHPRLTLEVLLTEQEEHRIKRARVRRRGKDYRVQDRLLTAVTSTLSLKTAADLRGLLPRALEGEFTTEELAREAEIPRWLAQKMAYCLRTTGAIEVVGKRRNAILYQVPRRQRAAA